MSVSNDKPLRVANLKRWFLVLTMIVSLGTSASCRREDSLAPQLQQLVKTRKETVPEERIVLGEKGKLRSREIQLLVNIIAPDPQYQPWYLSDDASVFEIRDQDKTTIRQRLEGYFGKPLRFEIRARQPLLDLVDEIKKLYPRLA
jgi:hypothetical protein